MRWLPNFLTLSRFPAAAAIPWLYYGSSHHFAVLLVVAYAFASDYLDGKFARALKCESSFGAKADPYADKAVCWAGTFVVFSTVQACGPFLIPVAGIFLYDVGIGLLRLFFLKKDVPTSVSAKRKTFLLMTSLLLLYVHSLVRPNTGDIFLFAGFALLWFSGFFALRAAADYLRKYLGVRWMPSIPYVL